jgi:hypothetical protein
MIAHGFEVDATDGSHVLAAEAERRLGRSVRVMRFDELSAIDVYDGVWANAALLHVPQGKLSNVLALILRALKSGGLHCASYKSGKMAGRDSFGRYYNNLDRDALRDVYLQSGNWDLLSIKDYVGEGYEGVPSPWIALTARKPTR